MHLIEKMSTEARKVLLFLLARKVVSEERWVLNMNEILLELLDWYWRYFPNAEAVWGELKKVSDKELLDLMTSALSNDDFLSAVYTHGVIWIHPRDLSEEVKDFCAGLELKEDTRKLLLNNITDGFVYTRMKSGEFIPTDLYSHFIMKLAEELEIPTTEETVKRTEKYRGWTVVFRKRVVIKLPTKEEMYEVFVSGKCQTPNGKCFPVCYNYYGKLELATENIFTSFLDVFKSVVDFCSPSREGTLNILAYVFSSPKIFLLPHPRVGCPKFLMVVLEEFPKMEERAYTQAALNLFYDLIPSYTYVDAMKPTVWIQIHPAVSWSHVESTVLKLLSVAFVVRGKVLLEDVVVELLTSVFRKIKGVGRINAAGMAKLLLPL